MASHSSDNLCLILVLLLSLFAVDASVSVKDANGVLQVHIVPHTHDDVGWLKTVDQYYYGAENSIQHAGVQYILDTVVDQLSKDSNKTFIYVEMAFFWRWWNEQNAGTKAQVKKLVANKQLEFVNAGWCMNDEATTDYNAIIDQMSLGLQMVEGTFGTDARPRVAWHIDPFGHSAEQATLFAKMGFDGFFFARIDYQDMAYRESASTLEMVWRGSKSLGHESDIFTGVLYRGYGAPPGFCFDTSCKKVQPIQDDPKLFDYNVPDRVNAFVYDCSEQAIRYTTNNIMLTFGSDFQYENARENFKNLDKLIRYVNEDGRVHAFYSTPSRYIDAVHKANETWTLKTDDFFPYADQPHAYWTGYFTSRPALKKYTRVCNSFLQVCKQLEAIHNGFPNSKPSSFQLQEAMGIAQHHDAVSGTERQLVADDYAKRLHIGQVECEELVSQALSDLAVKPGSPALKLEFCEQLNISVCPASQTDSFNVLVYNPLVRQYIDVMAFPVMGDAFTVVDGQGGTVPSQIVPIEKNVTQVITSATNLLYIFGGQYNHSQAPLGFKTYFVRPASKEQLSTQSSHVYHHKSGESENVTIDNGVISLVFDGTTGRLKTMVNMASGWISVNVDQQFLWWKASAGDKDYILPASGAYIFRPNGTSPFNVSDGNRANITIVKGPLVQEVRQVFSPWVSQVVRLHLGYPYATFEYTIGPIPIKDGLGKEVISRFTTSLDTNKTWYTDANGREMQKRIRNYRPTWKWSATEPVSGNYYPVNGRVYIKDESKDIQFTVLTDRSQGCSSLKDGQMELMLHRRLLYDDDRGLGEALDETTSGGRGLVIRGKHVVILDGTRNSTMLHRVIGERLMLDNAFAFSPSNESFASYNKSYNTRYSALTNQSIPIPIHILTLQFIKENTLLLRLEHDFQVDEPPYNKSVNVSLYDVFAAFNITSVKELTLGGNADISTVHRLQWNIQDEDKGANGMVTRTPVLGPKYTVTLNPMDIRTFEIVVKFKQVRGTCNMGHN